LKVDLIINTFKGHIGHFVFNHIQKLAHTHNFNICILLWIKNNVQIQHIKIWRVKLNLNLIVKVLVAPRVLRKKNIPQSLNILLKHLFQWINSTYIWVDKRCKWSTPFCGSFHTIVDVVIILKYQLSIGFTKLQSKKWEDIIIK
jgi:hypothetical protein